MADKLFILRGAIGASSISSGCEGALQHTRRNGIFFGVGGGRTVEVKPDPIRHLAVQDIVFSRACPDAASVQFANQCVMRFFKGNFC